MLPSPSLGPPLLSASWSPPLPCGIGFDGGAGGCVVGGAGGGGVLRLCDGFGLAVGVIECAGVVVGLVLGSDGATTGDTCGVLGWLAGLDAQPVASTAQKASPAKGAFTECAGMMQSSWLVIVGCKRRSRRRFWLLIRLPAPAGSAPEAEVAEQTVYSYSRPRATTPAAARQGAPPLSAPPSVPSGRYQATGPLASKYPPVGPSWPIWAIRTMIWAPSSTVWVPVRPLRSVAV